jgi:hypothetical protein
MAGSAKRGAVAWGKWGQAGRLNAEHGWPKVRLDSRGGGSAADFVKRSGREAGQRSRNESWRSHNAGVDSCLHHRLPSLAWKFQRPLVQGSVWAGRPRTGDGADQRRTKNAEWNGTSGNLPRERRWGSGSLGDFKAQSSKGELKADSLARRSRIRVWIPTINQGRN